MRIRQTIRWRGAISAIIAAISTLALTATSAAAADIRPKDPNRSNLEVVATRRLKNSNSDLCLAIPRASTTPGEGAIQWECNSSSTTGNPEQIWDFDRISGDVYTIRRFGTNLCLAIPNGSTDINVQAIQWGCNGGPEQQWRIPSANLRVINVRSGLCLAIPNASKDNAAPVIQWTCGPVNSNPERDWIDIAP